ncbi:hypothetical protein RND81_12G025600 [Saponaria officinalis]|uniref:Uncharacterized protein n=1 Tax=Saponaria officinalis TaxID=3572 RepID=A0AAW1H4B0_SAPOF
MDFDVLDITGQRYSQWKDGIIAHLGAMGLEHTIEEGSWATYQEKQKAHIFIRHHINEGLKNEYIRFRDPFDLLNRLEARFEHHHDVLLPRLREDWKNLRFHDFTSVNEYNSALFRISSQLEYCGDEVTNLAKLEKTFSTMGGPNLQYARQLRQDKFTKFTDLIAVLLLSEQHDKILLKNDNMRPSGSAAIPEQMLLPNLIMGAGIIDVGVACACRTPKHFVDLYQASIKHANKGPDAHFISDAIPLTSCMPTSNTLDITDYLIDDIAGTSNL